MDINSDGRLNLPELDIALLNIRNTLGIEFVPYEEESEEVEEPEAEEEAEEVEEPEEEEAEETSSVPSKSELNKMKKAELVDLAKSMDLPSSGTKADLIGRITKA